MNSTALAVKEGPWQFGIEPRFSKAFAATYRIAAPEVSAPTTSSDPIWFESTLARFLRLAELENNWDDRGSAAVRLDVLSFALRSVLPEIMPPTAPAPAVIPLGHGGVQLVWNADSAEIEVEVIAPNEVIAYHLDKRSGAEHEQRLTNNFASVADVMWSTFKG
jgi:hypothetical protein